MCHNPAVPVPDLLAADSFATGLGVRLVEAERDRVVVEMDVEDHHRDASGRLASGVVFSLADCALSFISNAERSAVAVATHLVRRADGRDIDLLTAVIEPVGDGGSGRAVTHRAIVSAGDTVVAVFTGTTLAVG